MHFATVVLPVNECAAAVIGPFVKVGYNLWRDGWVRGVGVDREKWRERVGGEINLHLVYEFVLEKAAEHHGDKKPLGH